MNTLALMSRKLNGIEVRLTRNIKARALDTHLAEPVVSFCFDDFPRSAVTEGGRMLLERGWTGTFYAAGSFCGREVDGISYFSEDDLHQIDEEGHEIGCHTFSHLRVAHKKASTVLDDLKRNAEFLAKALPDHRCSTFAYPFGDLRLPQKMLVSRQFGVCRGIWPGVNRGRMDFGELKAVPLGQIGPDFDAILGWIDTAVRENAWLIFFTHDIGPRPSEWGYQPEAFAKLLDVVAARRIKVLPVKNAVGLARFVN
ncbi:MAG TPA: polysaccharide deacetylase family protein [Stellaceae bacterium]|nr:polysaccharide deacetylase family protein [Stellaceae bacterium]